VVFVGTDLGKTNDYVGNPPLAQRIGRDVYLIDPRGTGHSQPSLNCPEVDGLRADAAGASLAGTSGRTAYVTAVAACRARFAAANVPVAQFGLAQQATDLDDLRVALGAGKLSLVTTGTTSRVSAEYARQFPARVDRLVLDTPTLPGGAGQAAQLAGITAAYNTLSGLCTQAKTCKSTYGDLHTLLGRAADTAGQAITVTTPGGRVLIDRAVVLRYVRAGLSDKDIPVGTVPEFLEAVVNNDIATLARLVAAFPSRTPTASDTNHRVAPTPRTGSSSRSNVPTPPPTHRRPRPGRYGRRCSRRRHGRPPAPNGQCRTRPRH
jgi:pimeloyl-ACP methyl ester carboxylesterase